MLGGGNPDLAPAQLYVGFKSVHHGFYLDVTDTARVVAVLGRGSGTLWCLAWMIGESPADRVSSLLSGFLLFR